MKFTRKTWGGGKKDSEVVLIEIDGGGHTWPGQRPVVSLLGEPPQQTPIQSQAMMHQAPSRNMSSTPKVPMVGLDRHRVAKVMYRLHLFPVPSELGVLQRQTKVSKRYTDF